MLGPLALTLGGLSKASAAEVCSGREVRCPRHSREGDASGETMGREPHPPSAMIAPTSAVPTATIMKPNLQLP